MGIQGLYPLLRSYSPKEQECFHPVYSLDDFANMRVGVDMYVLLHRHVSTHASNSLRGVDDRSFIQLILREVEILQQSKCTVIAVFDGDFLPIKAETASKRKQQRAQHLENAQKSLEKDDWEEACKHLVRSIRVNPDFAAEVLDELKKRGVECFIAPFEADAQLAYLSRIGYIDVVWTIDGDLLAFGSKHVFLKETPPKRDKNLPNPPSSGQRGPGSLMNYFLRQERQTLGHRCSLEEVLRNKAPEKTESWSYLTFLQICIMAGCDYVENIPRFSMKKSIKAFQEFRSFDEVIALLRRASNLVVPDDYVRKFERALFTFRHQWVFCPLSRKVVPLNPFMEDISLIDLERMRRLGQISFEDYLMSRTQTRIREDDPFFSFMGSRLPEDIAEEVCLGIRNPQTLRIYNHFSSITECKRALIQATMMIEHSLQIVTIDQTYVSPPSAFLDNFVRTKKVPPLTDFSTKVTNLRPSQRLEEKDRKSKGEESFLEEEVEGDWEVSPQQGWDDFRPYQTVDPVNQNDIVTMIEEEKAFNETSNPVGLGRRLGKPKDNDVFLEVHWHDKNEAPLQTGEFLHPEPPRKPQYKNYKPVHQRKSPFFFSHQNPRNLLAQQRRTKPPTKLLSPDLVKKTIPTFNSLYEEYLASERSDSRARGQLGDDSTESDPTPMDAPGGDGSQSLLLQLHYRQHPTAMPRAATTTKARNMMEEPNSLSTLQEDSFKLLITPPATVEDPSLEFVDSWQWKKASAHEDMRKRKNRRKSPSVSRSRSRSASASPRGQQGRSPSNQERSSLGSWKDIQPYQDPFSDSWGVNNSSQKQDSVLPRDQSSSIHMLGVTFSTARSERQTQPKIHSLDHFSGSSRNDSVHLQGYRGQQPLTGSELNPIMLSQSPAPVQRERDVLPLTSKNFAPSYKGTNTNNSFSATDIKIFFEGTSGFPEKSAEKRVSKKEPIRDPFLDDFYSHLLDSP